MNSLLLSISLIDLQTTQSAFSPWSVHLRGAQKLLAGLDFSKTTHESSRVRAQVAMLIW